MNKTTANSIARDAYRLAITRGIYETTKRDWHTNYYPEDGIVTVHYCNPKNENDVLQHVCKVRKSWAQF